MPRKNRRGRRWSYVRPQVVLDERPATCDDLARDLVRRGLASTAVLGDGRPTQSIPQRRNLTSDDPRNAYALLAS